MHAGDGDQDDTAVFDNWNFVLRGYILSAYEWAALGEVTGSPSGLLIQYHWPQESLLVVSLLLNYFGHTF